MVSFPLILNRMSLNLVYRIYYFDVIEGSDEERSSKITFVRFIGLARRSWQRGEGGELPGRPEQLSRWFFLCFDSILVRMGLEVVRGGKGAVEG